MGRKTCPKCGGWGKVEVFSPVKAIIDPLKVVAGTATVTKDCPECGGTGEVPADDDDD